MLLLYKISKIYSTPSGAGASLEEGKIRTGDITPFFLMTTSDLYRVSFVFKGGFGAVFKVDSLVQHKATVAFKIFARDTQSQEIASWTAIQQHVRDIPRLYHAEAVRIPRSGAFVFTWMDLVEGENVFELLGRGALSRTTLRSILDRTAHIIKEMHRNGFAHQDIKTKNIMYNIATDKVTVVDFGEAKAFDLHGDFERSIALVRNDEEQLNRVYWNELQSRDTPFTATLEEDPWFEQNGLEAVY